MKKLAYNSVETEVDLTEIKLLVRRDRGGIDAGSDCDRHYLIQTLSEALSCVYVCVCVYVCLFVSASSSFTVEREELSEGFSIGGGVGEQRLGAAGTTDIVMKHTQVPVAGGGGGGGGDGGRLLRIEAQQHEPEAQTVGREAGGGDGGGCGGGREQEGAQSSDVGPGGL